MKEWHAERLCLYPFLSAASSYVEETGVTLADLIRAIVFERARVRGKERIIEAITDGEVKKPAIISTAHAEQELLSYPFARILVSCIRDDYLVRRYALAEAKAAHRAILASTDSDSLYALSEEFGIRMEFLRLPHEQVQMPFVDYLRFAVNFREIGWKLVNRGLAQGRVKLRRSEFVRIIQEAINERIKKDLPLDVPVDICKAIGGYTVDIKKELAETRKKIADFDGFTVKDPTCFPPCISHVLGNLKAGINVPHSARFAVTAFLLNIGLTADEIIETYKNSPDFDEERTRYQVGHIAGDTSGVRYTAPSCATMRTYGNCVGNDEVCEKVSHPLSYYKRKLRGKSKPREKEQ